MEEVSNELNNVPKSTASSDQESSERDQENNDPRNPKGKGTKCKDHKGSRALSTYKSNLCRSSIPASVSCNSLVPVVLSESLVEQFDRITWQALLPCGSLAVVKAYADPENRDLEVACYNKLKCMQGDSLPTLIQDCFYIDNPGPRSYFARAGVEDPRVHAIVLSWVGPSRDRTRAGWGRGLGEASLRRARQILEQMHRLGVAHGDVHPRNMAVDSVSGRVFLFDFSHATTLDLFDGDCKKFGFYCSRDLKDLEEHLEYAKSTAAAHARPKDLRNVW